MTPFPQPVFQDLLAIQKQMNRLFGDMLLQTQEDTRPSGRWSPPVDIYETASEIVLLAEVPGMQEEEIELEISDHVLTLKGDRKLGPGEVKEPIHRRERAHGPFVRTFALPGTVQPGQTKATLKQGLLKVVLPKVKVALQEVKIEAE